MLKFSTNDRITYTDPQGIEVYAYIKFADELSGLYTIDYTLDQVSENTLKENTAPNFVIPNTRPEYFYVHRNYLIDEYVAYLNLQIDDADVIREQDQIVISMTINTPNFLLPPFLEESISRLNTLIEQLNAKSRKLLNKEIRVLFKYPFQQSVLKSILI